MLPFLSSIIESYGTLLLWLAGFFVVFSILTRLMPCNPGQPFWRKEMATDLVYFFVMPLATRFARILLFAMGIFFIFGHPDDNFLDDYLKHGYGPLSEWPIWLQAAIIFLISDVVLYWTHRWFHHRILWPIHAVHHSPAHVDWLSTYRFHPINVWLTFTLLDTLMLLVGFSPEAVSAMAAFNMVYSAMVHANLNWTFGPFRYLFASPVFHRWHHTAQTEGLDKNFAPTFPLLDIAFGTFYMPEDRVPEQYGVTGAPLPEGFVDQLVWPFKQRR